MNKKIILIVMGLLLLLACKYQIYVQTTDTRFHHFVVQVSEESDFSKSAQLSSIKVYGESESDVLWNLSASELVDVSSFVYGEVPEGFAEQAGAVPLTAGQTIRIYVRGGGGEGYVQQEVTE